jgi:ParB-like chromosome segregation protein Spo0J
MSLSASTGYSTERQAPVRLHMDSLTHGDPLRSGGLDDGHVMLLMETVDKWPPIVVWGPHNEVVDGSHRVEAARRLGLRHVMAVRFHGSREDAYLEGVRRNIDHGLPLRVTDRRRAAVRVLAGHPDWSDRRIASLCGLSGKTVARLRREAVDSEHPMAQVVGLERRVGRDGKLRPVQSAELRDRIVKALEENPTGSLRAIAAIAGASPETVRTVRSRQGGDSSVAVEGPGPFRGDIERVEPAVTSLPAVMAYLTLVSPERAVGPNGREWGSDAALLACGDGGEFARWFEAHEVGEEWHSFVWRVPVGHIYEVVDEARRRSSAWANFANLLEGRTR